MADWYVSVDGQTTGPHPPGHVVHWLRSGQVPASALLWPVDGSSGAEWLPVQAAWPSLTGSRGGPAAEAGADPTSDPDAGVEAVSASEAPVAASPVPVDASSQLPVNPRAATTTVSPAIAAPTPVAHPVGGPPAAGYPAAGYASGGYPAGGYPSGGYPGMPPHAPGRNPMQALADFAGVDSLEGFRLQELLSATFRRYSREEIERHFATGLPENTPEVHAIEPGWPKPWMFVRLLGVSVVLFVAFVLLVQNVDGSDHLVPGLIVVGSFAVPLSVLVFFFEVNSPRNVSLYLVITCLLVGGLISLALTLLLEQSTGHLGDPVDTFTDPLLIGVAEEVGKLVAVYVITMRLPAERYPWILNGMLFGAAVGAGFACFESMGYAFFAVTGDENGNIVIRGVVDVIMLRGALAPFGHVVWTALTAGALWRAKLADGLNPSMLVSKRVLRMLLIVVLLHATWDFSWTSKLPFFGGQILLGILAWVLAFGMLTSGLKQIKAAQKASSMGHLKVSGATQVLRTVGSIGS